MLPSRYAGFFLNGLNTGCVLSGEHTRTHNMHVTRVEFNQATWCLLKKTKISPNMFSTLTVLSAFDWTEI